MKIEKESLDIIKYRTICPIPESGYRWKDDPINGKNIFITLEVGFLEAVRGAEKEVSFIRSGKEKSLQVKIPAGIDDKQILRVAGKGEPGQNDGKDGDLRIQLIVGRHPRFQRRGLDIYSTEVVDADIAQTGGYVLVNTIDGVIGYIIRANMKDYMQVRLEKKGVPDLQKENVRGDQYVTFVIKKTQKGEDVNTSLNVSFWDAVNGVKKEICVDNKKMLITVPAGADDGQVLRIAEKGKPGSHGGKAGNLYVTLHVGTHEKFTRKGSDIYSIEWIDKDIVQKGGKILIETLDGIVTYDAKKPVMSDTKICLIRKGTIKSKNPSMRGNHYVTLKVKA